MPNLHHHLSILTSTISTRIPSIQMAAATRSFHQSSLVAFAAKIKLDPSLPLPPKGPPSSYALFFVDFVSRNKSQYLTSEGKVKTSELAKEAGKVWNDLGDAKKPFIDKAKDLSNNFKSIYEKYYYSLTPTQLSTLNTTLPRPLPLPASHPDHPSVPSETRRLAREKRGEPPKGTTGFFLFLSEFRKSNEFKEMCAAEGVDGSKMIVFGSKMGGRKWGVMSDEEKKVYADKAAIQRQAYKDWKASQPTLE